LISWIIGTSSFTLAIKDSALDLHGRDFLDIENSNLRSSVAISPAKRSVTAMALVAEWWEKVLFFEWREDDFWRGNISVRMGQCSASYKLHFSFLFFPFFSFKIKKKMFRKNDSYKTQDRRKMTKGITMVKKTRIYMWPSSISIKELLIFFY
jgi:hypothetical protein